MLKKKHIPFYLIFLLLAVILSYEITSLWMLDVEPEVDEKIQPIEYEDEISESLETNHAVKTDTIKLSRISPSTRIVYQYYYTRDEKLVTDEYEPPYYLIDMTRQQLESYYNDWEIIAFSNEKVVLRKNIDKRDSEGYYIIKEYDGHISVFYDYLEAFNLAFQEAVASGGYTKDDEELYFIEFMNLHKSHYLRETIDMPLSLLPLEEQESIKEGIVIYGDEELIRLLENYTS